MKETKNCKYGWPLWTLLVISILVIATTDIIAGVFFTIIFIAARKDFERWASKINKDPRVPFLLYVFLGLVGMLGYYIYYRIEMKRDKEIPTLE